MDLPVTRVTAGPAGLVAHLWFTLGHRPQESLLLLSVSRRRVGMVVRLDLPAPPRLAAALAEAVESLDSLADAAVVVVATQDDDLADAAAEAARRALDAAGLDVQDALQVREDSYRMLLCDDAGCCPRAGRPIAEVLSSEVAAHPVLAGAVVGEPDALDDVVPVPARERPAPAARPPASVTGWFAAWRRSLDRGRDWPPFAGAFGAALHDVRLRDAVLADLGGEEDEVCAGVLRGGGLAPGSFDAHPDRARLERATALLALTARVSPAGDRADALALLGFVAWYRGGSGPRARGLLDLALADRPGHRLADLLARLCTAGVPPPWYHGGLPRRLAI